MKKQVMIACLAMSGALGSTTAMQAQTDIYLHQHQQSHYTKRDGKKKTIKRTDIGAGAGAAVGGGGWRQGCRNWCRCGRSRIRL